MNEENAQPDLGLGVWLGRHQAFDLIAKRCSAADAECLKAIRDNGEYKALGLTWAEFCEQHAGVSRVYADRQIHYIEEYGINIFRMAEVMNISEDTYKLIAGSVNDEGIEIEGQRVPLVRENRRRIQAAVKSIRAKQKERPPDETGVTALRQRFDGLLNDAIDLAQSAAHRLDVMALLKESQGKIERLAEEMRKKTLLA